MTANPESGPRTFLVECYAPGAQPDAVALSGDRIRAAVEALRRAGGSIEHVRAHLITDDEIVYHLFRAREKTLVRRAMVDAALPYERIVESIDVEGAIDPNPAVRATRSRR
jgi:hypothetical protein